jgi:hypothetical protein
MLNIAIGHGMGAREVGQYRVGTARPTDRVVARTPWVVAGTPGMDAHPVTRYRAETAHPTDGEGEAGGETVRLATRDET